MTACGSGATSDGASRPSGLNRNAACARFYNETVRYADSDTESAAAYSKIAEQTRDPELSSAIQDVADAFAQSAPEISSDPVHSLCGDAWPTG